MSDQKVKSIMGEGKGVMQFYIDKDSNWYRYSYEPEVGASDNIYIVLSEKDSSVVQIFEGL